MSEGFRLRVSKDVDTRHHMTYRWMWTCSGPHCTTAGYRAPTQWAALWEAYEHIKTWHRPKT